MNNWHNYAATGLLDIELAEHIANALARDIAQYGEASLALSGGNTPKDLFHCLAKCELDWANVHITLVDERWVDGDSPDSNEQMLRDNLLQDKAASAQFVGLKTAHANAAEGLAETRERIATITKPFTAVVLGMGSDGHTASWFPQADNLQDLLDPAGGDEVDICDPVTAPHQRITLTLPAVLNSREIIVHIVGGEKHRVLESAGESGFPIAAVLGQTTSPVGIWWAP